MPSDPTATADALLPLLRQFCRADYGIALGGAHAKGVADPESDLDLYVFAHRILPNEERDRLCQDFDSEIDTIRSWGELASEDGAFIQGGTDFTFQGIKIECWFRDIDNISGIVAECQAGVVRRDLVTWTVMGFFNHCALSDLHHMIPLDDPAGILVEWQAAVRAYPPKLRATILREHMHAAKFWPENFHYQSAVQRQDTIYVMGIVQQVIHNLIQVIFALNKTYFPGEKKLEAALGHLAITPPDFGARIKHLLLPDDFGAQRKALIALVREVEALVVNL